MTDTNYQHKQMQVKFPKTTILMPAKQEQNKDMKKDTKQDTEKDTEKDTKQLREFQGIVDHLLDKNEEAIRAYISRYIYTSSISLETNQQLKTIFKEIRNNPTI
jgi:hypothetical protein